MLKLDRVDRLEPDAHGSKPAVVPTTDAAPEETRPFSGMLKDAEYMLTYAVEAGIEVDPEIVKPILAAIKAGDAIWTEAKANELAAAITKLAIKIEPVTAESLRACHHDAQKAIKHCERIALPLALFVVVLSLVSFVSMGISNKIKADISSANERLVTLHSQTDAAKILDSDPPPVFVRRDLQQFAAEMRSILNLAKELKWFSPIHGNDPCQGKEQCLQLDPMQLKEFGKLKTELDTKTGTYQEIREFANRAMINVTLTWGAIGNFILPVLYALLGACAAVLRSFSLQLSTQTFVPISSTPRFYIAGIGGAVVGIFNDLFGEHPSISPLALAFLVGYATDIFFSFLEGATQNLTKAKPAR